MSIQAIDDTDLRILQLLMEQADIPHKEVGRLVHLTGQAVGARIRKMREIGVIEGYTLRWNPERMGLAVHALITVFMKTGGSHALFQSFAKQNNQVAELHRVSGEGCYWMRVRVGTPKELNDFLDLVLQFGNYKVSLSIGQMK